MPTTRLSPFLTAILALAILAGAYLVNRTR